MTRFGEPKPTFDVSLTNTVSDVMHNKYHLSVLQWNPSTARKKPTQILSAACGRFHVVMLQEASDHAPHVSDQFLTNTDGNSLLIMHNKDTFAPGAAFFPIIGSSINKDTWGMAALVVRGLL